MSGDPVFIAAAITIGIGALLESGLTRRGLVALLHEYLAADSPGKRVLNDVLDALPQLADHYLTEPPA